MYDHVGRREEVVTSVWERLPTSERKSRAGEETGHFPSRAPASNLKLEEVRRKEEMLHGRVSAEPVAGRAVQRERTTRVPSKYR
jgi:hypothetical protein